MLVRWTALAMLLGLSGCSSTQLVTRWNDADYRGQPLQKILVVAILKNDLQRRNVEEEFVKQLEKKGVQGIPGYRLVPDLKLVDDKQRLKRLITEAGADSILIARLKGVDKEKTYVPPRTEFVPAMGMGYGYYGYYHVSYQAVYQPGYTRVDTVVSLETKLFASVDERLLWAGETRSFNPDSASSVARELADVVVKDIANSGLL